MPAMGTTAAVVVGLPDASAAVASTDSSEGSTSTVPSSDGTLTKVSFVLGTLVGATVKLADVSFDTLVGAAVLGEVKLEIVVDEGEA